MTRAKPQPFRFEPVKVRVVFPCGNLHPFPLDSHNLPRSVGYADGNSKTKFSRFHSDLPLYGQTASLTLQQTAGQGMRGVCNTPSNSPVVLWKQCVRAWVCPHREEVFCRLFFFFYQKHLTLYVHSSIMSIDKRKECILCTQRTKTM